MINKLLHLLKRKLNRINKIKSLQHQVSSLNQSMAEMQRDMENTKFFLEELLGDKNYYVMHHETQKELNLLKSNFITHKIFCYNLRNEFLEFRGLFEEVEK